MSEVLVDLPAERAVLAGLYSYGSAGYDEISDIITTSSFADEFHQIIHKCFEYLLKDTSRAEMDLASIDAAATALGYYDIITKPKEKGFLRGIINFPINLSNLRGMAGRVKKLEISRCLVRELDIAKNTIKTTVTGDEPIDHIMGLAENPIFDLTTKLSGNASSGPKLIGEGIGDYIDYLIANPVTMVGISTGYPLYDKAIGGGLRRGTVNLVAARPKIGKTSHADNCAVHIAGRSKIPVLNVDTELTKNKHLPRLLANLSGVDKEEIETGQFRESFLKIEKVKKAGEYLRNIPYHYESVVGMEFEDILGMMRRWIRRAVGQDKNGNTNPCVIIFDYFQLLSGEGLSARNVQEYQLLGFQIKALHNFMVRYDVPCLGYLQLNRDGITREETDVVSGSDRQVWTCSSLALFKKKTTMRLPRIVLVIAKWLCSLPEMDLALMMVIMLT
jgi:replicative DNA helicase